MAPVRCVLTPCRCCKSAMLPISMQLPHCAPTYSATLALLSIGTPEALAAVDRALTYKFFMAMKQPSGGFTMHDDGEVDVRATYTAIAIASALNILTPELTVGVADYLLRCVCVEPRCWLGSKNL